MEATLVSKGRRSGEHSSGFSLLIADTCRDRVTCGKQEFCLKASLPHRESKTQDKGQLRLELCKTRCQGFSKSSLALVQGTRQRGAQHGQVSSSKEQHKAQLQLELSKTGRPGLCSHVAAKRSQRRCFLILRCRLFLSLRRRSPKVSNCSPANRKRELGLDLSWVWTVVS